MTSSVKIPKKSYCQYPGIQYRGDENLRQPKVKSKPLCQANSSLLINPSSSHQLGTNEMMTLILKAYVIKVCHDCHTKHHLFDLDLEKYGLSSLSSTCSTDCCVAQKAATLMSSSLQATHRLGTKIVFGCVTLIACTHNQHTVVWTPSVIHHKKV